MFPGFVADRMLIARVLKFAASNIDTRGIFSNFCGIQARFTTTCHFSQKTLIFLRPAKTSTDPRPQHQFRRDFIVRKNVVGTWLGFLRHSGLKATVGIPLNPHESETSQPDSTFDHYRFKVCGLPLLVHFLAMEWSLSCKHCEHHLWLQPQGFSVAIYILKIRGYAKKDNGEYSGKNWVHYNRFGIYQPTSLEGLKWPTHFNSIGDLKNGQNHVFLHRDALEPKDYSFSKALEDRVIALSYWSWLGKSSTNLEKQHIWLLSVSGAEGTGWDSQSAFKEGVERRYLEDAWQEQSAHLVPKGEEVIQYARSKMNMYNEDFSEINETEYMGLGRLQSTPLRVQVVCGPGGTSSSQYIVHILLTSAAEYWPTYHNTVVQYLKPDCRPYVFTWFAWTEHRITLVVIFAKYYYHIIGSTKFFRQTFTAILPHPCAAKSRNSLSTPYIVSRSQRIGYLLTGGKVPSFIEKEGEDPKDGEDLSPESDDRLGVGSGSGGGQGGMLPPVIEATEDTQPDSAPQAPHRKPAFLTPESSRHEVLAFFREYADFMNVLPVMEIGFNKATDGISLYRYNREQMIDVVGDRYLGMKIYDDLQCCRYAKNNGSKKTP
ncbi:hypothetical protein FQN51_006371 [Onygenales sp. PD_10]|nr:hypothetical protein FQN51_006371 [Onygenales sp. PD_10]